MKLITLLKRHLPTPTPTLIPFSYTHQHFSLSTSSLQAPDSHLNSTFDFGPTIDSIHLFSTDPCFSLLGLCNTISSLVKIHAQLIVHGLTRNLLCETKMVSLYGFFGNVEQARAVFDRIQNPDLYSWKVMIRWYFLNDSYLDIIRFYGRMKQCLREQDNVVFSIVLKACTELRDLDEGMKLHCHVIKVGNPDRFVLTGLIDMYVKCGCVEFSRQVFDEIPERNVVSWTSMIVGYVQNERAKEGLILFNQMRRAYVQPNQFTMGSLLSACSKLDALKQGQWVHGLLIKNGMELNSFLATALLDMYAKCGSVVDAHCVLDELPTIDLVSWTAMIVGYTQRCHPIEALKLFTDEKWAGLLPNSVTVASVLSSCAQLGHLYLGASVHALGIRLGLEENVTVTNALIDMYAKCCMIEDAGYLFERTLHKDRIAWNAMITGYSQNGFGYDALSLFHRMRRSDHITPDAVTVVSVLSASASVGTLCVGNSIHAYAVKSGFVSSVYIGTALLNLYAKCGDVESARTIFDGMCERTLVTWSAMMGAYGMHGDASGSFSTFTDMLKQNMQPSDIMFTSILSACGHTGMVCEGMKIFNDMGREYCVAPSMKHYVCMVDLLARAGRLEDAFQFIEQMPIQADVSVWGALLHGCRLHSRMDLGEVAARRMLELQPSDGGYYVLMSNFYASDGKWDEAAKVRELMKERGLNKSPGYSSLGMDRRQFTSTEMDCRLQPLELMAMT
ncbi:hypothetical protein AAC387_Pa02g3096 [Persea americana]